MTESYLDWILAKAETAVRDAKTAVPTISKVNLNFENFSLRFGHCLIWFSFWNFQIFPVKEAAGFPELFQQLYFHLPSSAKGGRWLTFQAIWQVNTTVELRLTITSLIWSPRDYGQSFFIPAKRHYVFLEENSVSPATPLTWPTASFWNLNLYNPVQIYSVNKATRTSYVYLSIAIWHNGTCALYSEAH